MAREFYELCWRWNVHGNYCEVVQIGYIDDPSVANEFQVAKSIVEALDDGGPPTSLMARMQSLISEEAFLSTLRCRRLKPGGGNAYEYLLDPLDFPGGVSGPVSAIQVATCVIWNSDMAPSKTGRNFIPGVSIDELDDGRFSSDQQTAVDNLVAKVTAGLSVSAGILNFCIYDRDAITGAEITGGYCSPKPGTQRRREVPL